MERVKVYGGLVDEGEYCGNDTCPVVRGAADTNAPEKGFNVKEAVVCMEEVKRSPLFPLGLL